jgi:hypothetical protein
VDEHVRPPPPPPAYARYLGLGGWYLRDANWWPDWPTSAAQIELAWSRAGYGPLDGVIAIDSAAVGRLLRAVGPVRVPEYGVVSANNFERLAAEQLYTGEATARAGGFHRARAAFLGPIGRALADSVDELSPSQLRAALLETVRLLDEKHVQLALKDGRLSRLAYARGWDGRITRGASDGALVIDTTVSYGDTYAFVRSSVRDEIEVGADGRVLHNLTLTYRNQYPDGLPTWMPSAMVEGTIYQIANGTFHSQSGLWGGWVRAYLPESASEVSVAGLEDTAPVRSELGKLVVTGFLRLEPGQVRTATIRYQYQRELRGDSLLIPVQKQAGLHCRHTHILVNWSDGKHDSYDGCPSRDGVIEFRRGE